MTEWPESVDFDAVYDTACSVSIPLARKFTGYVEQPDIRQEVMVWALKNLDKIEEWLGGDDPDKVKIGQRILNKAMYRAGMRYARTTKAKIVGYETTDEYYYNRGVVESLIYSIANDSSMKENLEVKTRRPDPAEGDEAADDDSHV